MAASIGILLLTGILSATSSGISAKRQQQEINNNICDLVDSMTKYKGAMKDSASVLSSLTNTVRGEISDLMFNISDMQNSIRMKHSQFKKTYMMWSVGAIIFMILLVFIFASKIIILKASTTGNR